MTLLETIVDAPNRAAEYLRGGRAGDRFARLREDGLAVHAALASLVLLLLFPVLVAIVVSTKESGIVTGLADLVPGGNAYDNYYRALVELEFYRYMLNSLVMASVIVVGKLAVSLLAVLAVVYYRVPYKDFVFLFILFTLLLPVPVRFVPLYRLVTGLGWNNTVFAITVPYLASATTVFVLRQHFLSIPPSLVENAKLDGVGPLEFLWRVLIPMSKGILVGVSVIIFVYAWNQYLWPLVIVGDDLQVAQVGLGRLRGQAQAGEVAWALTMTGSVLTLLPPLVLLVLFRKPLLETFSIQRK
ncbi:glycerol-3-phosphate ABC transporter permease [Halobacteriales archaeon QS_4_69_225]|nr:MAG: glycerol-3-phosphate ABC transporter permease [Halobacteriales archaeon QS_4_69_225]